MNDLTFFLLGTLTGIIVTGALILLMIIITLDDPYE